MSKKKKDRIKEYIENIIADPSFCIGVGVGSILNLIAVLIFT